MQHFPFFEVAGSPFDVGRGVGERFRAAIQEQLSGALDVAAREGLSREDALGWAQAQVPKLEKLGGEAWIEELRGLSEGADIPFAGAVALQVRPGSGAMPEGCTSLGVSGDATVSGQPLGAQNRDLVPAYRRRMCVLLLRPRGRPALLMHSVPGELGGVGLNEHGLSLFANSLWARSGRNWQAAPVTRRALLECASCDEAVERAQTMDGPTVGSLLLIDAAGRIRNLETLPGARAVIARDTGVFVHTNHCLDTALTPYEAEQTPSPGSPGRCTRMQALLDEAAGKVDVAAIARMLADHAGRPEPICRHAQNEKAWETASAVITEPATRTLHLSFGPPCEGRFATYRL